MNMRAWRRHDARKDQGAAAHKRLAGPWQGSGTQGAAEGWRGRCRPGMPRRCAASPARRGGTPSCAKPASLQRVALHQRGALIVWGCNTCGRQERCKRCKTRMTAPPRPATAAALPSARRHSAAREARAWLARQRLVAAIDRLLLLLCWLENLRGASAADNVRSGSRHASQRGCEPCQWGCYPGASHRRCCCMP